MDYLTDAWRSRSVCDKIIELRGMRCAWDLFVYLGLKNAFGLDVPLGLLYLTG